MEMTLILGKTESRKRRGGWQRTKWLASIIHSMDMSLSKFQEIVNDRDAWQAAVHGAAKSQVTERLNNNKKNADLYFMKMTVKSLSPVQLFATSCTIASQTLPFQPRD